MLLFLLSFSEFRHCIRRRVDRTAQHLLCRRQRRQQRRVTDRIAVIQLFKEYCALMFFKGAMLQDVHGLLVSPGENTQAGRQIRFTAVAQIVAQESILKAYIAQAIEVEKTGLQIIFKLPGEFAIPEEWQRQLDRSPTLKAAFEALTPDRQRAYLLHFSGAKESQARASRIEKCRERILTGKGLQD